MVDSVYFHTPSTSRPILGVLTELVQEQRDLHNVFVRYATEARAAGKPLVVLRAGPFRTMMLVADPLVADQIMRSADFANRTSFPIIDATYAQFVGATLATMNMGGITFVNSEPWRRNRQAALHCLSRPHFLERVRAITIACVDRLIESWHKRGFVNSQEPVDLGREMSRLAIDVMGHLCWTTDLGAIEGDHERFFTPVHTMLDAIQRYIYVPIPASILRILPTKTLRRMRAAVEQLRSIGDSLMESHFNANGQLNQDDSREDVLSFLLRELVENAQDPSKDDLDNVQATLMDLLGAGHDTTANAMAFCLGLLSQPSNFHWQELVAKEALMAHTEVTDNQSQRGLHAAYRETLRLFPLGAVFSRVPLADTALTLASGEKIPIPFGTQMLISPYVMGRDTLEWKEANRFRPERHLADPASLEQACPRHRTAAYAPYGAGKRVCVGAQFAEIEVQLTISRILQTFRLRHIDGDEEIEANLLFTMRPRKPLRVFLEKR